MVYLITWSLILAMFVTIFMNIHLNARTHSAEMAVRFGSAQSRMKYEGKYWLLALVPYFLVVEILVFIIGLVWLSVLTYPRESIGEILSLLFYAYVFYIYSAFTGKLIVESHGRLPFLKRHYS